MKNSSYFLPVATGILLWLAWPPLPFFFLAFIAFIPLLHIEQKISHGMVASTLYYFKKAYPALFIWNIFTTWWIINSSIPGGLLAFLVNPLLMSIPFLFFHNARKVLGPTSGYVSLLIFYLSFEYLHMRWELAWPWLNLGNSLAMYPITYQWYEFTGASGGTLWILMINILIYEFMKDRTNKWALGKAVFVVLAPLILSAYLYFGFEEKGDTVKVSIIQPNFDPYEKVDAKSEKERWKKLEVLFEKAVSDSTEYVVIPEATIPGTFWLNQPESSKSYQKLAGLAKEYQVTVVAGIITFKEYQDEATPTARYFESGSCCYDIFNSAIQIEPTGSLQVYHKSKLVPGSERIPYPALFKFLEPAAAYLGGISGSLGKQNEREIFTANDHKIAPVICFESVFGEYVTDYIKKGAQSIFIITNDGWWGNTAGYQQHLYYASIRAVENRKSIVRSANTGVSCFINQRGNITKSTEYWTTATIRQNVLFNDINSIYVRYGDIIGRVASLAAVFLLLSTFVRQRTQKIF